MLTTQKKYLNLENLPEELRKEIIDFYDFLLTKCDRTASEKVKVKKSDILPKPVSKFIPLKREEIYAR